MKKRIPLIFILCIFSLFFISITNNSCDDDNIKDTIKDEDMFDDTAFFNNIAQANINAVNEVVEGFSSPVETAALMKDYHIPFSKAYMVDTKIIDAYTTNIKYSIGLGILSADLGYLNVYEKKTSMIEYLLSINRVAQELRVSQYFDFQTLKRLVTSSSNMDSLMFLSVNSYLQIDKYFRTSKRSYLSVLSVTGVWIESLYLITQVAKNNEFTDFKDQVGSQKELLGKLTEIMKTYKGHPKFDKIIVEFENLQKAFEGVTIEVRKTEGRIEVVDDILVIYPDEETIINISDEDMKRIIDATETARNAIINL